MELASEQEPTEGAPAEDGAPADAAAEKTSSPPEPAPAPETTASASATSPFPTKSPLDGSALPHTSAYREAPPADVAAAVKRAREAQRAWGEMPARDRALRIAKVKKKILSRAEE